METQITGSIRTTGSTSNKLKVCLNFRPSIAEQLKLADRRFVHIYREPETTMYRLKFYEKDDGRCRPVQYKRDNGSALVIVDQGVFDLSVNEQKTATPIPAQLNEDGLVLDMNPDGFMKAENPSNKTVSKLESTEDKVEAGFDPGTSWGVAYRETAEEDVKAIITDYFKFKAGVLNAVNK